ncbi:MAG: SGNH/GDSL hydrolase family protein [Chitinophagaceae bacterium]
MKYVVSLFFIVFFSDCSSIRVSQKKIVFFGDSITELGVKPSGYITELKKILSENNQNNYQLIGSGISGDKVYDLYLRLEEDVLAKKPHVVVIWIGVNDVWHKKLLGTGTDPEKFEKIYNALIKKLKQNNIRVYLSTPAVIGERTEGNELDKDLEKYASIIRSIAQKNDCTLIDLRKLFLDYNKIHNTSNLDRGILTYDGVHLNDKGNQLVAQEMYKVLHKTLALK